MKLHFAAANTPLRWKFRVLGLFAIGMLILSQGRLSAETKGSAAAEAALPKGAFRVFNDTVYTLAYDVFLEARNIKSAFELAQEAVRQRPDLFPWRERLARMAEWAADPGMAQREWEKIGARTGRPHAYREAIRLAGLMRDPAAAARAWEGLADIRDLEMSEWFLLLDAYENSGETDRCLVRLRKRLNVRFDRPLAIRFAEILMRTDRDQEALEILKRTSAEFGTTPDIGIKQAEIYCRRGQMRKAAAILDSVRALPRSEKENAPLLRLQASIYTWMQRYGDALDAYRRLFLAGEYNAADLHEMSVIARQSDPDLALKAAVAGWTKFRDPDHLVYYLERCIDFERWDLASRMLSRLTAEQWALGGEYAYFHVLTARIHQREGKTTLARKEYRHALALDPGVEEYQAGYLWLLIEQGRMSELSTYADRLGQGSSTSKTLIEPLAMAYKMLQRQSEAMAYYRLLEEARENANFPFLYAFAEILKEAGDGGGAERVYQRAQQAKRVASATGELARTREWQESQVRWSHAFGFSDDVDAGLKALQRRYPRGIGIQEMDVTWKMQRGHNPEDAMSSLGVNPEQEKTFSSWARLAVAMRREDVGQVSQMLENGESGLGREDRDRAAAFVLARRHRAGFEAAAGMGSGLHFEYHPYYHERKIALEANSKVGDGVRLTVVGDMRERPWISKTLQVAIPDREDAGRMELAYSTRKTTTRLSAGFRSTAAASVGRSEEGVMTVTAEEEWQPLREATFTVAYAGNTRAEENPILALVGMKDAWKLGWQIELPAATQIQFDLARSFFHGWDGRKLGDGYHIKTLSEHRPIPPFSIGAALAYHHFSEGEIRIGPQGLPLVAGLLTPGEFPRSYWHASISAGWQSRLPQRSSWIPSPLASAELGRNVFPSTANLPATSSNEFALKAGLVLPLAATQSMTLLAEYARGLQGRQETETALSLRYGYTLK